MCLGPTLRSMSEPGERDYVLGTHEEEIERLGLQHRVWRPRALDAWARAGFSRGQTLIDVGCGPGHATLDLAEIVGPSGRVVAVDRSRRFLDAVAAAVGAPRPLERRTARTGPRRPAVRGTAGRRGLGKVGLRLRQPAAGAAGARRAGAPAGRRARGARVLRLSHLAAAPEIGRPRGVREPRDGELAAGGRGAGHRPFPPLLAARVGPGDPRAASDRRRGGALERRLEVAARLHRGGSEAPRRAPSAEGGQGPRDLAVLLRGGGPARGTDGDPGRARDHCGAAGIRSQPRRCRGGAVGPE